MKTRNTKSVSCTNQDYEVIAAFKQNLQEQRKNGPVSFADAVHELLILAGIRAASSTG